MTDDDTTAVDAPFGGPSPRIPMSERPVVRIVCEHPGRKRFRCVFTRVRPEVWSVVRADTTAERAEKLLRQPRARGGVVLFSGGHEIGCTVCGRRVRIRNGVLYRALETWFLLEGKEIDLDTVARVASQ